MAVPAMKRLLLLLSLPYLFVSSEDARSTGASASFTSDVAGELGMRDHFHQQRCGCVADNAGTTRLGAEHRSWLLEVNPWGSHRLVTLVAAILLRDYLGYDVDLNFVHSSSGAYSRAAKRWSGGGVVDDGVAVAERLAAGSPFGYANMELWPVGKIEHFYHVLDELVDAGPLGYEGRSGWFVPESFAKDPSFAVTPEFYRAFDASRPENQVLIDTLRQHGTVDCGKQSVCYGLSPDAPQDGGPSCWERNGGAEGREVQWCQNASDGILPAVLAIGPGKEAGFDEEIAGSHGFRFALRFVGPERFAVEASNAVRSGAAQVIRSWRPSLFLTHMRMRGKRLVRIMMPYEDCGNHTLTGTGQWACDYPSQLVRKVASKDVDTDHFLKHFLSHFNIPESGSGNLEGGGIREIFESLVIRMAQNGTEPRAASAAEIFDTACDWVCKNKDSGLSWTTWVDAHDVPVFADTTIQHYSLWTLLALIVISCAYIAFLENPWLWTTLSVCTVRQIFARNESVHWRSSLEARLWQYQETESSSSSRSSCSSDEAGENSYALGDWARHAVQRSSFPDCADLPDRYWAGLLERSVSTSELRTFWARVEQWVGAALSRPVTASAQPPDDMVYFAHHTFPCLQSSENVEICIRRSTVGATSGSELAVQLVVEEVKGGAVAGKDFEALTHEVVFPVGKDSVVVQIPVTYHKDAWNKSYVFQVRLSSVLCGTAVLAAPAQAQVLVLDDDAWPANIPPARRAGQGISIVRYFVRQDRLRRGEKWTKTMLAMLWLPVHSVVVSTMVQKVLVDHAMSQIMKAQTPDSAWWFYLECVMLVAVQLFSLGLNRWADVVQTRNRGRTGGVRQVHRSDLLHKFMHLEHSEHWEASDANWLYSAIYDADVITGKAYFQVFVLFQSVCALFLSLVVILCLQWLSSGGDYFAGPLPLLLVVCFAMIPVGLFGVWARRKLTWVVVITRKTAEMAWFRSCTWIISNWRQYYGLLRCEREALEKRVLQQNAAFIPAHWDARDTMNDTAWIAIWLQGVSYCFVLLYGIFTLIDAQRYGIGVMEVGTFYALCKVYVSVGKYVGRLSRVFVDMQQAIVSLREIAALFNQVDQRSQRREAKRGASSLPTALTRYDKPLAGICFDPGVCFMRPGDYRVGATFAEMRLKLGVTLPLERVVHISARNERILRSFLGLTAQVIYPTTASGEDLQQGAPTVSVPRGLRLVMIPTVPVIANVTAPSIIEQLEFTGAPASLCAALAESVGLEPSRTSATLGPGSAQVFSIVRALLVDPDVLVAFRPLALVPLDVRPKVASLLRFWQGGGGLPAIAAWLGCPLEQSMPEVYMPSGRTLVVGNSVDDFPALAPSDVYVDLDTLLWKDDTVVHSARF